MTTPILVHESPADTLDRSIPAACRARNISRVFASRGLYIALALAIAARACVVWKLKWNLPNSDEAISGLMAKHIAEGRALPIFFYGQAYFGALEAYLEAPLYCLFGFHANLLLVVPAIISVLLVAMEYVLVRKLFSRDVALASAFLIALAPLPFLEGTLIAAGGFGLACLLELIAIWLFARLFESKQPREFVAFCAVSGLTCWIWQLYMPILLVLLLTLMTARRRFNLGPRVWLSGLAAFLAAASPWWIYSVWHPGGSLKQCVIRFLGVNPNGDLFTILKQVVQNRMWSRYAYMDAWLTAVGGRNWVLLALVTVGIAVVIRAWWPKRRQVAIPPVIWLLVLAGVALIAGHRALRYLYILPLLMIPSALAGWKRMAGRWWVLPVMAAAAISTWPVLQLSMRERPAGIWQQAAAIIQSHNLRYGYTNYWDAYPLVYLTNERVIVAPILENEGAFRAARYPAYDRAVALAPETFLLLPDSSPDRNQVKALLAEEQTPIHQVRMPGATLYWPLPLQSKVRGWLTHVWKTDAELKEYETQFGAAWMKEF